MQSPSAAGDEEKKTQQPVTRAAQLEKMLDRRLPGNIIQILPVLNDRVIILHHSGVTRFGPHGEQQTKIFLPSGSDTVAPKRIFAFPNGRTFGVLAQRINADSGNPVMHEFIFSTKLRLTELHLAD